MFLFLDGVHKLSFFQNIDVAVRVYAMNRGMEMVPHLRYQQRNVSIIKIFFRFQTKPKPKSKPKPKPKPLPGLLSVKFNKYYNFHLKTLCPQNYNITFDCCLKI